MRLCVRSGWAVVFLIASAFVSAQVAPIPMAGELPGRPFAIQKNWVIGGNGDWGYLTLDTAAGQLFVAHASTVQVVDLSTGSVAGTVTGLRDAHAIVLGNGDGYGYVTDGPTDEVKVFDRSTFEVVGSMPTGPQPRALALDPSSGLLLAICGAPTQISNAQQNANGARARDARRPSPWRRYPGAIPQRGPLSSIAIMDPQSRKTLAIVVVAGTLGFAKADGAGHIYVSEESGNQIERFDVQAMANELAKLQDAIRSSAKTKQPVTRTFLKLDWSGTGPQRPPADVVPFAMRLDGGCQEPRGIAVDSQNYRLFVACANQKMAILNSETGANITTLTIGPGADAIAYDPTRSLIFTANGGGYGSLTVVRQHLTDTYAVIQNLPTLADARTMAVDSSTGSVYLVTTLYGAKLGPPPANGIGKLKMDAISGTFQVLVIGRS
ncbi:MAG: YncE family protein [Acidobacteriota bacterium]